MLCSHSNCNKSMQAFCAIPALVAETMKTRMQPDLLVRAEPAADLTRAVRCCVTSWNLFKVISGCSGKCQVIGSRALFVQRLACHSGV